MFRLVFLAVFGLIHFWLGARLIGPLPVPELAKAGMWVGVVGVLALYPTVMTLRWGRGLTGPWIERLALVTYVAMGVTAILICLSAVRDVGWLVAHFAGALPEDAGARDALLNRVNLGVVTVTTLAALWGNREARRVPRVKQVTVPIAGLPDELVGFTIAQLTDLHIGTTIQRGFVERVVAATNALAPDAIALTGDFIDGSVDELRDHAAPLGDLRARHGVFYVTGNHEYYSGAVPWVQHFRSLGIKPLLNEHEVLDHDGKELVMAGVCDHSAGQFVREHTCDPKAAVEGAPDDAPRVLLAHQPRTIRKTEGARYDLMLSGHTHGGQIWPWNFFVPLQQPTIAGLDRVQNTWVYTSRGTGFWGPPLRVGAPSEIALLTLVAA